MNMATDIFAMFIYTSDSAAITICTHCAYHITRTKKHTWKTNDFG